MAMSSVNIPSEQWAQIIEQPQGSIVYKKIPVPAPGPDEVLVHVQFSGVCHTDLHALRGDWPLQRKTPLVGGHEGAGVVVAKGQLVTNIDLGSRVGIKWLNGSCLNCSFCLQGDEQLCPHAQLSGYTVDGTFQQYAVAKADHVTHIPPDCNLAEAAPILCAGVTVHRGLKEACVRSGQIVAIVGAGGGLGCLALQYAKAMGLRTIAVDAGDDKARTCRQLGAETFVDFARCGDLGAALRAATPDGFGPHAVLLIAAKEEPFHQASQYVRPHGTVVCIGIPGNAHIEAPVFSTVIRMVNVKGSYIGNRQDAAEAIDFFQRGLIKAPYKLIGLSQLQEAYDQLLASSVVGRYVVDTSK